MPTFLDKVWVVLYVIVIFLIACIEYLPVTGALVESFTKYKGGLIVFISVCAIAHVRNAWSIPDGH